MKEGEPGAKAQSLEYVRQILRKVILSQHLCLVTERNKWSWKIVRKISSPFFHSYTAINLQ